MRLDARHLGQEPFHLDGQPVASPSDDLIDFARAVLAPAYDVPRDDLAACRQPVRWQLLREDVRSLGLDLPTPPTCTALAGFADPQTTTGLEVWFVAPTGSRAAASFGHILLRLVRPAGERDGAPEVVYEISALTGVQHSLLDYLARGLGGGFPLVFEPVPIDEILHDSLGRDQRGIQRFRLDLTAGQRRHVLRMLWQAERTVLLPYRFLNRNCATYLLWLLATALDDLPADPVPLDDTVDAWESPAAVLDRLAEVKNPANGQPLLQHVAGGFETSRDRAERAEQAAVQGLAWLDARLDSERRRRWQDLDAPAVDVADLVRQTLAVAPDAGAAIDTILLARVLASRAAADRAQALADKVDEGRIQPIPSRPLPNLATVIGWRKAVYAHEDPQWHRERLLERVAWVEDYLQHAPRRPATPEEQRAVDEALQARRRFDQATEDYASAADVLDAGVVGLHEAALDVAVRASEQERWHGQVVRSGNGWLDFGWHADGARGGPSTGAAIWREELGQWRPHGGGPLTALVLADLQTVLDLRGTKLSWLHTGGRLFERAVVTYRPAAWLEPLVRRIGWGLTALSQGSAHALTGAVRLDGYVLWLDGTRHAWLSGARAGLLPQVGLGRTEAFVAQLAMEVFLQRRVGATGSVRGFLEARRSLQPVDVAGGLRLDWPWGPRESWRTPIDVHARRDRDGTWSTGWSAGISW